MVTKFILAYEVGEHTYTCKIDAASFDEAERHLRAIAATGRVSGEWVCDVPEQEPAGFLYEGIAQHTQGKIKFSETRVANLEFRWWREKGSVFTAPPDDEALLRQALDYITADDGNTMLDPEVLEQARNLIAALRKRLGETG